MKFNQKIKKYIMYNYQKINILKLYYYTIKHQFHYQKIELNHFHKLYENDQKQNFINTYL